MTAEKSSKHLVGERFSQQAEPYDRSASLQRGVAGQLARALDPWRLTIPPGPVLEFGAGTGFLTGELLPLLPGRTIHVTDLAAGMVEHSRNRWSEVDRVRVRRMDAEEPDAPDGPYALITGNFAAQWFRDPALTLGRLADLLLPGGLLLTSFPGEDSLPEWRRICVDLGLPWTGNPFPGTEEMVIKLSMGPHQVDYYEERQSVGFPDAISFFRHLREIGADTSMAGKRLRGRDLRMLVREWDRKTGTTGVSVTWHLVFLALKRDS